LISTTNEWLTASPASPTDSKFTTEIQNTGPVSTIPVTSQKKTQTRITVTKASGSSKTTQKKETSTKKSEPEGIFLPFWAIITIGVVLAIVTISLIIVVCILCKCSKKNSIHP